MSEAAPRWQGINHLALVTPDMEETVRFYHGVLGARLVTTIGTPSFRHYFFEFAPGNTVAFFEYRGFDVPTFSKPAGVPDPRAPQFDHISFNVEDEAALEQLRRHLKEHQVEVTDEVDHEVIRSIYFNDPHGIALEASYWVRDATASDGDPSDDTFFGDPDPVPAVRELADTGQVTWRSATHLTPDGDPVI